MIIKIDNISGVPLHGCEGKETIYIPKNAVDFEIEKSVVEKYKWFILDAVRLTWNTKPVEEKKLETKAEKKARAKKQKEIAAAFPEEAFNLGDF